MITVHNLNNSRSFRMIWFLEELGLEYQVKQYSRNAHNGLAPDDYKKLHPLGKSPILTDGDEVLVESGAIVEAILERYADGKLQPAPGSKDVNAYRYWMHASEGSLMPYLVMKLIFGRMVTAVPFFMKPILKLVTGKVSASYLNPSLEAFLGHLETTLGKSDWVAGDSFTAADIMMGYPTEVGIVRTGMGDRYPNIKAYIERLQARPAHKKAMEKNGPFMPMS